MWVCEQTTGANLLLYFMEPEVELLCFDLEENPGRRLGKEESEFQLVEDYNSTPCAWNWGLTVERAVPM